MRSVGQAASYILQAMQRGDERRACEVADRLVQLAPQDPAAWDVFAFAFDGPEPGRALDAAKRALALDPTCTLAAQTLARREAHADPRRAVRRLTRSLIARPATHALWILLTRMLLPSQMKSPFAAPERRAVLLDPGNPDGWLSTGHWSQAMGERGAAVRAYLRAAILAPASALPLYHLSIAAPDRLPEDLVRTTKDRFAANAADGYWAELTAFALAYHADAAGDEDAAFAWLQRGNGERRKRVPSEMSLNRATLRRILEAKPARRRPPPAAPGPVDCEPVDCEPIDCGPATPIFIVGLPGSGTTLVESMLAMHPDVAGGGELPFIDRLAKTLTGYPTGHVDLGDERLDDLASRYLALARDIVDPSRRYFTDKMPNNFTHVGLIRCLFPSAPIIHPSRHPMAVGWSQFRRRFETGQTYSTSLEDIAEFIALHDRYMAHWARLWPGSVLDMHYERLVADPESGVRRMLAHAGLTWDPACLDYARAGHRVTTASAAAVRGGLDERRIEDWRRYARHLEPLRDALLRHGVSVP